MGESALIVGAGNGLSASLARLFHSNGMRVMLAARDIQKLGPLIEETKAYAIACDASDPYEVEQMFESADKEIGTPRSHRRFLGRHNGSYGPIPAMRLPGLLTMPFNSTAIKKLYCVGDSCFPGQGLNAVAFSGFACAHKIGAELGLNSWKLPD